MLLSLYLSQFLVFLLVLTRISGLVMTAPILSMTSAPLKVRAMLAIGLSLVMTPMYVDDVPDLPANLVMLVLLMGREAVIGLSLGLSIKILFAGLQLTGQIVGQMSGMSLADVFDPNFNSSVPMFAQLLDIVALAVFVCIGGHRKVMHLLIGTFQLLTSRKADFSTDLVTAITTVTTQSFALGIRAAAPAMVALLLSVLILGLISRTLPQLNILAVGFSLNSAVMLVALALSLGSAIWIFEDHAAAAMEVVSNAFFRQP